MLGVEQEHTEVEGMNAATGVARLPVSCYMLMSPM